MNFLANHDPLTELYNRRFLEKQLNMEMERARRYESDLSIVIIRLAGLSDIRAQIGPAEVEDILKELGSVIDRGVRNSDQAGRLGENDSCVILPETPSNGTETFAERIRDSIMDKVLPEELNGGLTLNCKIGTAQFDEDLQDANDFFKRAFEDIEEK
jgi:diguanylate cyclase (GGDEF)-like protein